MDKYKLNEMNEKNLKKEVWKKRNNSISKMAISNDVITLFIDEILEKNSHYLLIRKSGIVASLDKNKNVIVDRRYGRAR